MRPAEVLTPAVACAIASLRTGELLDNGASRGRESEQLENLAATLPEIFGTVDPGCLNRIALELGGEGLATRLGEVLLLSGAHVHVIQPLASRPGVALVAVSPRGKSVGLILSEVHAHRSALAEAK